MTTKQINQALRNGAFYRNGELCEYTGNQSEAHGMDWLEIVVVGDSHRIGHKMVTAVTAQGAR